MPKSNEQLTVMLPMGFTNLPPDCEVRGGKVKRIWIRERMYGDQIEAVTEIHDVAATIEEAQQKRMDYYDPDRGWLLEGWKWQSDPGERGLDSFTGMRVPHYLASSQEAIVMQREAE